MLLYRAGLGYEKTAQLLGVSHTAVWEWVHRCRELFASQKVPRRRLFKGRKPRVFVDGGAWYPWALKLVGFRWTVVALRASKHDREVLLPA
jgi:transposase-like protein